MASFQFSSLILIAVLFGPSAWGQAPGSLRGQVIDPSGAVIPAATVAATGPGNQVKVAATNQQGSYVINGLSPGNYTIRVMAKGFAVFETRVDVRGGAVQTLDASLVVTLEKHEVTVTEQSRVDVDPSNNASALILKGADLDMLSDDPDDLASDLQALAGPGAGPN